MSFLGFGTVCCPSAPHVCSYSLASMLPGWDWLLLSGLCWLSAGCPGDQWRPSCMFLAQDAGLHNTLVFSRFGHLGFLCSCGSHHPPCAMRTTWAITPSRALLGVWVSSQHKRPHCLSLLLLIIAWVFCFWVSLWCILLSLKGIGISLIAYWGRSNSHVYKGGRGREWILWHIVKITEMLPKVAKGR